MFNTLVQIISQEFLSLNIFTAFQCSLKYGLVNRIHFLLIEHCFWISMPQAEVVGEDRAGQLPKCADGENVFGVAHIFASFNDTFVVS